MKEGAYGEQCKVCSLWVAGHNRLDDGACQTCVIGRLEADNARLRGLLTETLRMATGVHGAPSEDAAQRGCDVCEMLLEAQLALNKE